jgi:AcrR family transcriptional regulator
VTEAPAEAPRRGRPSTGARERNHEAALEVMKAEGYAGTTLAKVAAKAGESKALVAYHYGSKQGLVSAAGREIADQITSEVLAAIDGATSVEQVVQGVRAGTDKLLDEDVRIGRLYFDLAAVSVVDEDVRKTISEVNAGWRRVVGDLLKEAGVPAARARALTVMVIAGNQGMALERIERGNTPELRKAQELFVRAAVEVAGAGAG